MGAVHDIAPNTPVAVFEPGEATNTKKVEVCLSCAADMLHRMIVKHNACMHYVQKAAGQLWDYNTFASDLVKVQLQNRPPREQQLELALRVLWHVGEVERDCYIDEPDENLTEDAKELKNAWRLARQVLFT